VLHRCVESTCVISLKKLQIAAISLIYSDVIICFIAHNSGSNQNALGIRQWIHIEGNIAQRHPLGVCHEYDVRQGIAVQNHDAALPIND